MPAHNPIDPNDLPKHHHQLVNAVRKRCASGFDGAFARARIDGATLGVFEDGVEADAPFVGRVLANVVKPQGTGQEVEGRDEPVYFYVEDDLLNAVAPKDRDGARGLLPGEVIGDPTGGERVRMVERSYFTSPQGYGRGPEDATPDAPQAGGLG